MLRDGNVEIEMLNSTREETQYDYGTKLSLKSLFTIDEGDENYMFTGWQGNVGDGNHNNYDCEITLTKNLSIIMELNLKRFELVFYCPFENSYTYGNLNPISYIFIYSPNNTYSISKNNLITTNNYIAYNFDFQTIMNDSEVITNSGELVGDNVEFTFNCPDFFINYYCSAKNFVHYNGGIIQTSFIPDIILYKNKQTYFTI